MEERARAVKEEMKYAYDAYANQAAPRDELRPLSRNGHDSLAATALTAIESLDTLLLMNLTKRYKHARSLVKNVSFARAKPASTFEVTIRVLGGLLAAYSLTSDALYLDGARATGDWLLGCFGRDGAAQLPWDRAFLHDGSRRDRGPSAASVAEVGTLSLEFDTLARFSGEAKYSRAMDGIRTVLEGERTARIERGHLSLLPMTLYPKPRSPRGGGANGAGRRRKRPAVFRSETIGLGARGDSYFEYLAKEAVLEPNKLRNTSGAAFARALDEIGSHMLMPIGSGRTFIAELQCRSTPSGGQVCDRSTKMDHLACFLPATIALAIHHGIVTRGLGHEERAEAILDMCLSMYSSSTRGLAPEITWLDQATNETVVSPRDHFNLLRPETAESLYFVWMLTRKRKYRDAAWDIFSAFRKHARLERGGYASLRNVLEYDPKQPEDQTHSNDMPSYFLAETLKYLFLIFCKRNYVSWDDWVFNTEAHPLPIVRDGESVAVQLRRLRLFARQLQNV